MPWRCPACGISIQHTEDMPREGVVYRCQICRLELVADHLAGKLTVAPLPADRTNPSPAKSQKPKGPGSKRGA